MRVGSAALIGAVIALLATHTTATAQTITQRISARVSLSTAPIVCVDPAAPQSHGLDIDGTAFFLSQTGEVLTAAHVLQDFMPEGKLHKCVVAIAFQVGGWNSKEHSYRSFRFDLTKCQIDAARDIGLCTTDVDLTQVGEGEFEPPTLQLDTRRPSDVEEVAFSGFPVVASTPVTARGTVASYSPNLLIIDCDAAWPGNSGSPVYDSKGDVLGMILSTTMQTGFNNAVPSVAIAAFIKAHPLLPNN
jgi:V8-like Glu-specific endopeptidase